MKLFHYHFWTNRVEETENYYRKLGFTVAARYAMEKGTVTPYHPPLEWKDFRENALIFRIIEVRRGKVNITFGAGKKPIFDHIGYLVNEEELAQICNRADVMGWKAETGARRTFIFTPYRFKIELQTRKDTVSDENISISHMMIKSPHTSIKRDLERLFHRNVDELLIEEGEQLQLQEVLINGVEDSSKDPNKVIVTGC
ncbi:hypothetical protein [Fictibacillus fluitans]|uniref:VOC domain-containing protein n=1 Tax=Fictibacillus fluitans TaxID=3058422 RepID=A0ABT8HXX7_9BACL|nr:hypothetical protein [Fictibacillus sp. NE201]MDN4525629.1 hypothetical protein [Fictibacillus sp. NE201]